MKTDGTEFVSQEEAGWTWALPPKGIKKGEQDHDFAVSDFAADGDPLRTTRNEVDHGSPEPSQHKSMIPFGKNDPLGVSLGQATGDPIPAAPPDGLTVVEVDL